jgi:hypothetical protein
VNSEPLTKADLELVIARVEKDLNKTLLKIAFWMIGVQITYFFGTLASVWFLVTHH